MTTDSPTPMTITKNQALFVSWSTDVLIYLVVLNLFVEFYDAITIDSFAISILTAVLLTALLDVIVGLEHRVSEFFAQRDGTVYKIVGYVAAFTILFGSKFIILEIVNLVFGDRVELGHFVDVIILIIAMMIARAIVDKIFYALGDAEAPESWFAYRRLL